MNRKVALVVSAGAKQSDYSENGRYQHKSERVLIPFETTLFYFDADYRSIYAFYGKEGATEEDIKMISNFKKTNEYIYVGAHCKCISMA